MKTNGITEADTLNIGKNGKFLSLSGVGCKNNWQKQKKKFDQKAII